MTNESPFLLFKVECPVCKTINEFEQVKVGAYTEGGRDTDFCPQEIDWRFPKYQGYNPLVFFTATCSNCFYTRELTHRYKEWKSDTAYRTYQLPTIKTKHLEQLSTADSPVKMLGDVLDVQRYPNESAIIKMHLAVFDALLADHPTQLDIGRFYLRIAWVFRDLDKGGDPNQMIISGHVTDIEEKSRRLKQAFEAARERLDELARTVSSHFDGSGFTADTLSKMLQYRERYDSELIAFGETLTVLETQAENFMSFLYEYREAVLGETSGDGQAMFGYYRSFTDFLFRVKKLWNGVVTNEREALEQAIRYYKEAFTSGRDIAAGNQQIQASYLIAELSRRIGDFDGAKQYFTSTIKAGQEFIYQNRRDQSRTQLARKILELAIEQGRANLAAAKVLEANKG